MARENKLLRDTKARLRREQDVRTKRRVRELRTEELSQEKDTTIGELVQQAVKSEKRSCGRWVCCACLAVVFVVIISFRILAALQVRARHQVYNEPLNVILCAP